MVVPLMSFVYINCTGPHIELPGMMDARVGVRVFFFLLLIIRRWFGGSVANYNYPSKGLRDSKQLQFYCQIEVW